MRCKMMITSINKHWGQVPVVDDNGLPVRGPDGHVTTGMGKVVQVTLVPVYAKGDPAHENSRFWAATPSGELKLTLPDRALEGLDVIDEVYVDITKA